MKAVCWSCGEEKECSCRKDVIGGDDWHPWCDDCFQKAMSLRGQTIVVSSKRASEPDFFEALMEFQYGDQETSDKAFEKMKKKAKK